MRRGRLDRPFSNLQTQLTKQREDATSDIGQKLEQPLPLIQALLTDLQDVGDTKENYTLNTDQWLGVQFTYTVAEPTDI